MADTSARNAARNILACGLLVNAMRTAVSAVKLSSAGPSGAVGVAPPQALAAHTAGDGNCARTANSRGATLAQPANSSAPADSSTDRGNRPI
jgi:hypothetical protein